MERHGSETYFVLGETVGGRDRTLASELEAQTPAFRFSRLGPRGTQRQPTESPLWGRLGHGDLGSHGRRRGIHPGTAARYAR